MNTLVIDTSTDLCLLALVQEDLVVHENIFPHENRLSKWLLPSIQALLETAKMKPADLKEIAVGKGPGSYTGTRLGASVAKTLCFALNIPLKAFYSPLAFMPNTEGAFLLPTKAGLYFLLKPGTKATFISASDLHQHLESTPFFVMPDPQKAPQEVGARPCLQATVNLPNLAAHLSLLPLMDPEEMTLEYLHTPF
jgi:tRNA threonylcarbamoyl adenosine modification protein YeaZ